MWRIVYSVTSSRTRSLQHILLITRGTWLHGTRVLIRIVPSWRPHYLTARYSVVSVNRLIVLGTQQTLHALPHVITGLYFHVVLLRTFHFGLLGFQCCCRQWNSFSVWHSNYLHGHSQHSTKLILLAFFRKKTSCFCKQSPVSQIMFT